MTAELYWLALTAVATMFMGFPYVLERIVRIGGLGAANYTENGTAGFDQPSETPPHWAARAYKAHRNALESLPIVGILVLIAHAAGVQSANVLLGIQIYFFARLAHYFVYILGVPIIRPVIFFIAWGGMALIAYTLLA